MSKKTKHVERVPVEALTCKGKIPYTDFIKAFAARDRLQAKVPDVEFRVYPCKHCGEYHVGSIKKKPVPE